MLALLGAVALATYGLDLGTKEWALRALRPGEARELIGSVLQLNLTFNPGAAFSLGTNATWVLTAIACIIVVAILVIARRLASLPWAVCLGLLLGGATGNLTDRFFRAPGPGRGHVVDFLQLPNWPIFNVADMAVVGGALLAMLLALRGIGVDGVKADD